MNIEKRAIRQRLRAYRRALPPEIVEAAGRSACTQLLSLEVYRRAASVLAYIDSENEVPTGPLLAAADAAGKQLYLPTDGTMPRIVRWRLTDALRRSRNGVLEPVAAHAAVPVPPVLAVLPVVGWDIHGGRLGRGGGFYDRLLADLDGSIVTVGLAYEFQQCDEIRASRGMSRWSVSSRSAALCGLSRRQ